MKKRITNAILIQKNIRRYLVQKKVKKMKIKKNKEKCKINLKLLQKQKELRKGNAIITIQVF